MEVTEWEKSEFQPGLREAAMPGTLPSLGMNRLGISVAVYGVAEA